MGKSIDPMLKEKAGSGSRAHSRRSSASMSLQPAIPWQVALPQGLPPLHRPGSECAKVVLPVENFAANGEHRLNSLCQPRGQPQFPNYTLADIEPCDLPKNCSIPQRRNRLS